MMGQEQRLCMRERETERDPLGVKLEDRVCADNVFGTMEKRDRDAAAAGALDPAKHASCYSCTALS